MKKVIIITIAFFISVSASPQLKYGIKAGVNVSQLSGIDMGDGGGQAGGSGLAYGLNTGIFANYSFSHLFGFQPEVLFSMQGGAQPKSYSLNGGTDRFYYINVPLLLEIKPFKSRLSFLTGPQLSFCVSRSFVGNGIYFSNNDYYKDFDFAIPVGMKYALTKQLSLELRYYIGLIRSLNSDYSFNYGNVPMNGKAIGERNRVLQLSVGWTF
jgi:hypothetical protein